MYRDIEIEAKSSLYALAEAITHAFEFDFDHAFGFFSRLTGNVFASPVRYELFVNSDANGESHSVKRTTLPARFPGWEAGCCFCSTTETNGGSRSK